MRVEVNNYADFCISMTENESTDFHDEMKTHVYFESGQMDDAVQQQIRRKKSVTKSENELIGSNYFKRQEEKGEMDQADFEPFRRLFNPKHEFGCDEKEKLDFKGVTLNSRCIIFWTRTKVFALTLKDLQED